MTVSTLLTMHGQLVLAMNPDFTLTDAASRFATPVGGRRLSLAVVPIADDHVEGVISLGDIAHALADDEETAARMTVHDGITRHVTSRSLDDLLPSALKGMADRGIRHIPLVQNDRLAGLVARPDVLDVLHQQASPDVAYPTKWVFRADARS